MSLCRPLLQFSKEQFTNDEVVGIIQLIREEKGFSELTSNTFWKRLQQNGRLGNRSWHAVYNHFNKIAWFKLLAVYKCTDEEVAEVAIQRESKAMIYETKRGVPVLKAMVIGYMLAVLLNNEKFASSNGPVSISSDSLWRKLLCNESKESQRSWKHLFVERVWNNYDDFPFRNRIKQALQKGYVKDQVERDSDVIFTNNFPNGNLNKGLPAIEPPNAAVNHRNEILDEQGSQPVMNGSIANHLKSIVGVSRFESSLSPSISVSRCADKMSMAKPGPSEKLSQGKRGLVHLEMDDAIRIIEKLFEEHGSACNTNRKAQVGHILRGLSDRVRDLNCTGIVDASKIQGMTENIIALPNFRKCVSTLFAKEDQQSTRLRKDFTRILLRAQTQLTELPGGLIKKLKIEK